MTSDSSISPEEEADQPRPEGPILSIELEYDSRINYAMQQNDVPVVKLLQLVNQGTADLHDLQVEVWIDNDLSPRATEKIARIDAGHTWTLETLDLPLKAAVLREQREREAAALHVAVSDPGGPVCSRDFAIEILACNEWGGLSGLPEILAAFVSPNQDAVERILGRVRDLLAEHSGDGSISGYQSGDPARVATIAQACYVALQELRIGYINPPASFEDEGQKIRLPHQIEEMRLATCLDISLLFAACFEQCGLHALVYILQGHAFVGLWTIDHCYAEAADYDVSQVRRLIALGHMIAIEATAVTSTAALSFDEARRMAQRHLEDEDKFLCAIDIRAARKLRIRPLPLRERVVDEEERRPGATPGFAVWDGAGDDRSAAPRVSSDELGEDVADEPAEGTPATRLEKWKHKLLDLSLRNRLLNFRESKRTIPLMCHDLGELEDALANGRSFELLSKPEIAGESSPRDMAVHQARTNEDALRGFLEDDLADDRLRASLSPDELAKRVLDLYRLARNNIEETGSNTLFVAFGFLAWYESESSEARRLAPIILLPIQVTRKSVRAGYRIRLNDDDPRINVTLLKKLENEFDIDVSSLDELPEDDSGLDVAEIFQRFRAATLGMRRWDVVERADIGIFSFNKFLMWQDLEENSEMLLAAPVVRHLAERPGEAFGPEDGWPDPRELDETCPAEDVFCPLDADSSQMAAVIAAEGGKTFVLQGPPGTGKSQTITNLIAHALGHGQRVLFVAEKMAALNVVHDRLSQIGLASACLEIHSNKANKLQVLEQIGAAWDAADEAEPVEWADRTERLERRKAELNAYVRAIHSRRPCGLSFFEATSRLIGLREVRQLDLGMDPAEVEAIDRDRLAVLHDQLGATASAAETVEPVSAHPLRALAVEDFRAGLAGDLDSLGLTLIDRALALGEARLAAGAALGVVPVEDRGPAESAEQLGLLVETLRFVLETPGPDRALLTEPGWAELRPALENLIRQGRRRDDAREALVERYGKALLDQDPAEWQERIDSARGSFVLWRWLKTSGVRRALKRVIRRTPPDLDRIEQDLAELSAVQEINAELSSPGGLGAGMFGRAWAAGEADWDALDRQLEWSAGFREALRRLRATATSGVDEWSERVIALATDERDSIFGEGPQRAAAEAMVEAWERLGEAVADAEDQLCLEVELGFGDARELDYLRRIEGWVEEARAGSNRLREWCQWRRRRAECLEQGLSALVSAAEAGELLAAEYLPVFDRWFLERLVHRLTDRERVLRSFNSHEHERRIAEFRALDRQVMQLAEQMVQARVTSRMPSALRRSVAQVSTSEVGILMRQRKLKRRHMAIRKLFESLPTLLPRLKPCLLMSPLSVAQYLSEGYPRADLVIFDEASQIPVWDAIGALARGEAAVVVGDSKQLPPTNFFQRVDSEDEDDFDELIELESILDECEAGGVTTLSLDWHYRSQHESLIAFSNHHYYDNRLLTFPSAADEVPGLGVSLRYFADGVYDKGKSRTNKVEAQAICDEIVRRLQDHRDGDRPPSIGVVAFSQVQQNLIEDYLDAARRANPEIEEFFGDAEGESVFVKNLENVQGDERDTILFSICYGPDLNGKVAMAFGPLNRDGGERRLNVAITRARREVIVFSSLRAEDIDLRRSGKVGVRHLRTFLDYAERGTQAIAATETLNPDADFDSPFEHAVYRALSARGHAIDIQVGCSGYRIDLAVRHPEHPGRYLLGIECDGASYHSSATARDRDRLREAVLARLGWNLHRIWSTDWWENPEQQIERAITAIEDALARDVAAPEPTPRIEPIDPVEPNDGGIEPGVEAGVEPGIEPAGRSDIAGAPPPPAAPASVHGELRQVYPDPLPVEIHGDTDGFYEPASIPLAAERLQALVEREAPIQVDLLFRRVAECWGIARVGSRIRHRLQTIVGGLAAERRPRLIDGFVWRPDQDPESWRLVRVPAADDSAARRAEEIPPQEVANAAAQLLATQLAMPLEDLERETARVFGISRLGTKVRERMNQGVLLLEVRGGCLLRDGQVTVGP